MEIYSCPACKKSFNLKPSCTSHKIKCKEYQKYKLNLTTKEQLEKLYVTEGKSTIETAEILKLENFGVVISLLKYHKIPIRNISQAALQPSKQARASATNMKNYGSPHNFCRDNPSRLEWQKRLLQEEGIVNVFQRESVKIKSVETLQQKYNVTKTSDLSRVGRSTFSKAHKKIVEFLLEKNISHSIEYKIIFDKSKYRAYDIKINNKKLLIEINGDYWHANPAKYRPTDIILYGTTKGKLASEIWQRDLEKSVLADQNGFKVLTIWESEIKKDFESVCKLMLETIKNAKIED